MNLSQDEISAMLSGAADSPAEESRPDGFLNGYAGTLEPGNGSLTPVEIDTLGEVGNICMGAVATTMYMLLDRRVEITTPKVSVLTANDVLSMYQVPFVVVEVEYIEGVIGKNLLLLKEEDAALITDVLMGGEGVVEEPIELSELHMSAINEIMNQMIGASATALSQVIGEPVNISTPVSRRMSLQDDSVEMLGGDDLVIVITFDMEIEGLLSSQLVQFMPYEQGRAMSAMLTSSAERTVSEHPAVLPEPPPAPPEPPPAPPEPPPLPAPASSAPESPPAHYAPPAFPLSPNLLQSPVAAGALNLIYDIPVQVSVELGRTKKEISEILEFDRGTVVVLEKVAGDPVEILVNGKLVASGEVVVIDENYGVRITALHE